MNPYTQIEAELEELGYTSARPDGDRIRSAVMRLLYTLDAQDLSQTEKEIVTDLVSHITRDDSKVSDFRGRWTQFELGSVKLGSVVRVKWDAYDSETGKLHNGLVGVLVSAFAGRCTIQYIGRKDNVDYTHPPKMLEVLAQ